MNNPQRFRELQRVNMFKRMFNSRSLGFVMKKHRIFNRKDLPVKADLNCIKRIFLHSCLIGG